MRLLKNRTTKWLLAVAGVLLVIGAGVYIYFARISADGVIKAPQKEVAGEDFAPGEILVKFKSTVTQDVMKSLSGLGVKGMTAEPLLVTDTVTADSGVKALDLAAQSLYKLTFNTTGDNEQVAHASKTPSTPNKYQDELLKRQKTETISALENLLDNPNIETASLNFKRKASWVPNDPYYNATDKVDPLWNLKSLSMDKVWDISQGENVVVAVIDTGVDYTHPDLAANMDRNISGISVGRNFTSKDPKDYMDKYGHGTHIAGTIAATGNNGIGIVGLAPKAKIMPIKGLGDDGCGYDDDLINGVYYAYNHGAKILNISWGGIGTDPFLDEAFKKVKDQGAIVIVAAGNDSADASNFSPASSPSVITVGASDSTGKIAYFSNLGPKIDVVAPGVNILSTMPKNSAIADEDPGAMVGGIYAKLDGTSMATPHVSAQAALLLSKHPNWNSDQILNAMRQNATDAGLPGPDDIFGYGIINPLATLSANVIVTPPTAVLDNLPATTTTGQFTVSGTAGGVNFKSYEIGYRKIDRLSTINFLDQNNYNYIKLAEGSAPVENGKFVDVNLSKKDLPDGFYYFRLLVKASDGTVNKVSKYIFVNRNEIAGFPITPKNSIARSDFAPDVVKLDGRNANLVVTTYCKVFVYDKNAKLQWVKRFGYDEFGGGALITIANKPIIKDLNGDGKMEIIVTTYQDIIVLDSTGKELWRRPSNDGNENPLLLVADFNNDKKVEIVIGEMAYSDVTYKTTAYKLTMLSADGKTLTKKNVPLSDIKGWIKGWISVSAYTFGDVNNDHKAEIVISFTDGWDVPTGENEWTGYCSFSLALIDSNLNKVWIKDTTKLGSAGDLSVVEDQSVSKLPQILTKFYRETANNTFAQIVLLNKNGNGIKTVLSIKTAADDYTDRLFPVKDPVSGALSYVIVERVNGAYNLIHNVDSSGSELPGWPSKQDPWSWAKSAADVNNDKKNEIIAYNENVGPLVLSQGKELKIAGGRYTAADSWDCAPGDLNGDGKLECYTQASDVTFIFQSFWPSIQGIYGWQLQ